MAKTINIISCKIFEPELEAVLEQIKKEKLFDCEMKVTYLSAGLHKNLNRLGQTIVETLDIHKNDEIILLYGSMCHPRFNEILEGRGVSPFSEENCLKLIMPDAPMYEKGHIYVTTGWIKHWREIGEDPFGGYDEIGMRQSFGIYDTMIVGDTGVTKITDEEIIEVFDAVGVPIETKEITLEYFKGRIIDFIKCAISNGK